MAQDTQLLRVGADRDISSIAEASRLAKPGMLIEVDAGDYTADVAVWMQDGLTLRAASGRVRLLAAGNAAEGKAIWVVRAEGMQIEGFDFIGARVAHKNGAGIRLEKGSLRIQNCTFIGNENGILTSNDRAVKLQIVDSEFGYNGYGDGLSHNLYAGEIARLEVRGCYVHHAKAGHLIKSRAALNLIHYNRLTDEIGGTASYELEFPTGGIAYVVGNVIQQDSQTQNPHLISYGIEGYKWPRNKLYLVNNTLIDKRPSGGIFLRVKPGDVAVRAVNNLLVGEGKLESAAPGHYANNYSVDWNVFVAASREDYRLRPDSILIGRAVDTSSSEGADATQQAQYRHSRSTVELTKGVRNPGAMQNPQP